MAYSAPRLRPLGVGDLLDSTISLYRRNFLLFIGIGALVMLPLAVLQLSVKLVMYSGSRGIMGTAFLLDQILTVVYLLAYMATFLAMTCAASEVYLGRRTTVRNAYEAGLRRFRGTIGLGIVGSLALLLMSVTILGIPAAIYFGICWVLSTQARLLEGLGIRKAMSRSRALVKGRWWRVVGVLILLTIIQMVVSLAFSLPQIGLGVILYRDHSQTALAITSVVSTIFSTASQILWEPISFIGLVLLYYDHRVRKEGFDLELMAGEVEAAPEATA